MKTIDNAMFTKMFIAAWKAAKAANSAVATLAAEAGIAIPDYSLPEKNARLNVLLQLKMMDINDEAVVPEVTKAPAKAKKGAKKEVPAWIPEPIADGNVSVEDSVKEALSAPLDDLDEELDRFFAEEPVDEPETKEPVVSEPVPKKAKPVVKAKKVVKEEVKQESALDRIKKAVAAKKATSKISDPAKEVKKAQPASAPKKAKKAEPKVIKVVPENDEFVVSVASDFREEINKALDSVNDPCVKIPFVLTEKGIVRSQAVVAYAIKNGIKRIVVTVATSEDYPNDFVPSLEEADNKVRENFKALVAKLEASEKVDVEFVQPVAAKKASVKASGVKKVAKVATRTNAPKKGSVLSRLSTETESESIALSDISLSEVDMDIIAS